jgi:hypothetical protein
MHYWTLRDGIQSLACFHNVFSILEPDVRQPCTAWLRVFDAQGRAITTTRLEVEARGSRMVDVGALLGPRRVAFGPGAEGSLELDLAPPPDFHVAGNSATGSAVIGSYFYMLYRSSRGLLTTVHSIDRGALHRGVPAPVGRILGMRTKAPAGGWRSKRLIWNAGLREVRAVAINHAAGTRALHLGLRRGADGPTVAEAQSEVPACGLLTLEYAVPPGDSTQRSPGYLVYSNGLATANGKPYVWVGYGQAPMSVHHG